MLSIGEFSKICQVSVKTLHHYDKLGLLVPAQVDVETGYRYYEAAQLDRMAPDRASQALRIFSGGDSQFPRCRR